MPTPLQKLCAVIPVQDDDDKLAETVTRLIVAGLDCVLVDNGSTTACADALDRLTRQDRVFLLRLPHKQDKGRAVLAGLREARQFGYTHALHVDIQDRYDLNELPRFARQSAAAPDAVICGYRTSRPSPAARVPRDNSLVRLAVAVSTLSLDIKDATCSFRIYPLAPVLCLATSAHVGSLAAFATDILVRLHWHRQPIYWLSVTPHAKADCAVRKPGWHDKLVTTRTHLRLLIGMLARAPQLLWCRWQG